VLGIWSIASASSGSTARGTGATLAGAVFGWAFGQLRHKKGT